MTEPFAHMSVRPVFGFGDALPEHRDCGIDLAFLPFPADHPEHFKDIFDGFDLDWEYPGEGDAQNYLALLQEFRKQLDAVHPGLQLTIAAGPSPHMYHGVDFAEVAKSVDLIGLMNYDYSGPWHKETGFHAPLYSDHGGNADGTVRAYENEGVPANKLLLGVPFYGYSWKSVGAENHGLFQPGEAVHEDRPYNYIQTLVKASTMYRDPAAQAGGELRRQRTGRLRQSSPHRRARSAATSCPPVARPARRMGRPLPRTGRRRMGETVVFCSS